MSETSSVSDLLKKFNEKPVIGSKPIITPKPKPPGSVRNNNHVDTQPVNSQSTTPRMAPAKSIIRPNNFGTPGKFGAQPSEIAEGIKKFKLKRAPPPKAPVQGTTTTPSEDTELSKVLQKRNSRKFVRDGSDKENKGEVIGNGSVKIRSDSMSSTNSSGSNASSIALALGGKPQRIELPSVRECGHRPPKRAKPPLVRLSKATPPKPKPPPVARPPTTRPKPERQVSLIRPTSDSEGEEEEALYDDTEATPAPPPLSNIPNYQSAPKEADDFGDTYDMVGDTGEDIYEAVDSSDTIEGRMPPGENNAPQETQDEKAKEKQRKELEKQMKKEEEKREKERTKKEREEKKRREKEEKDNRKKFNIKGEISVLREMVATESYTAKDKLDIGCYSGETLDLIREDSNPQDRWLVRNKQGVYGYVQICCVDIAEPQELYDDVAVAIVEDDEEEEVYDLCS